MRHSMRVSVLSLCLAGLVAVEAPAPAMEQGQDTVQVDIANFEIIPPSERWVFSPPLERRDVFYDLEAVYGARLEILRMREQDENAARLAVAQQDQLLSRPVTDIRDALERAEAILADVQQAMANENWDQALKMSASGVKLLTQTMAQAGDRAEEIQRIIDKLARYRVLAEEAKLLAEAKQEFAKLGLAVEGILWSADTDSLAIISGEPYAEQDRVKDILIVNIDVNRVDFMFTYKSRRFEFQRYIGE